MNKEWQIALALLSGALQTPYRIQQLKRERQRQEIIDKLYEERARELEEKNRLKKLQGDIEEHRAYRRQHPSTFSLAIDEVRKPFEIKQPIGTAKLPKTTLADLRPDIFEKIQEDPKTLLQFMALEKAPSALEAARKLGIIKEKEKKKLSFSQMWKQAETLAPLWFPNEWAEAYGDEVAESKIVDKTAKLSFGQDYLNKKPVKNKKSLQLTKLEKEIVNSYTAEQINDIDWGRLKIENPEVDIEKIKNAIQSK